jgi:formylglycine-generating enzyme required for sulfatase activity
MPRIAVGFLAMVPFLVGGLGQAQSDSPRLDSTRAAVDAATVKKSQEQWAAKLGMKVVEEFDLGKNVKLEMVLVPPGVFTSGSPKAEQDAVKAQFKGAIFDGEEQARTTVNAPFYVGKFEVTQEQYEAIKGKNPSSFSVSGEAKDKVANLDTRKFPVEMVSWEEANEYCKALEAKTGKKFKLIKEVEWEYACRAGSTTAFHFGPELNGRQANCNGGYPFGTTTTGPYLGRTCQVGSYPANALGLHDMHGNVWEWCEEIYTDKTGSGRSGRSGSWSSIGRACRAANREWAGASNRLSSVGFRVAMVVPTGK